MTEILLKSDNSMKLDSELLTKAVIKLMKQDISERFIQTREITDEDWEFCEAIDWHPVDELPMKESFIKELEEAEKETPIGNEASMKFLESLK
ncbi:MAG: hypothetical protein V1788_02430 [Nanoarchaeota archaeon]